MAGASFSVAKQSSAGLRVRLGKLVCATSKVIDTPHYVGITSRGVVPHLSQDVMSRRTGLQGVYIALEDFVEKASSNQGCPILNEHNLASDAPMHAFASIPNNQLVILGPRRCPPVPSPHSNTQTAISIYTSVGFAKLEAEHYADAAQRLRPDIVVGIGDMPFGEKPGHRRIGKMSGRTERHMREIIAGLDKDATRGIGPGLFAPILPIEREQQALYLDLLAGDWRSSISGLAIYDASTVTDLPSSLESLPRLSLTGLKSPQQLLREISLGCDIFTLPFLGTATDAGIALTFRFGPGEGEESNTKLPLGIEMMASEHAAEVGPILYDCQCFTCTKHHRAYVQHLLSAKEMLAWVLLQIHNLAVMDAFFAAIRRSMAKGTFEDDVEVFSKTYEPDLPQGAGHGPRIRGYQFRAQGPGEPKRNEPAFRMLNDRVEQNADAPVPGPQTDADDPVD